MSPSLKTTQGKMRDEDVAEDAYIFFGLRKMCIGD